MSTKSKDRAARTLRTLNMTHSIPTVTLMLAAMGPDFCRTLQQDPWPDSVATLQGANESHASPETLQPKQKPAQAIWRLSKRCGVNCIYLVLSVLDSDTDYDLVLRNTKIGEKGSSLVDLKQSVEACGYQAEINTLAPRELPELSLPVIAHLDETSGRSPETGHYVVISNLSIEDGSITIFDGITAQHTVMPLNEFYGRWSGHILRIRNLTDGLYLWFCAVVVISCGIWTIGRHLARKKAKPWA